MSSLGSKTRPDLLPFLPLRPPFSFFLSNQTEVVVAPPTIYLSAASETAANSSISIAAQNCYIVGSGAFTGEISPHMLAASSIPWVIIGHSERRTLFDDTSALVAKKTAAAIAEKIKVILCIGETLEQREADKTMDVCKEQLDAVVEAVKEEDWK
jgi:triosephosphate isomerase